MRPRQACLGMPVPKRRLRQAAIASMRPRQACLGMVDRNAFRFRRVLASMRPRQACLGMHPRCCAHATHCRCFNEAEASLPRNAATAWMAVRSAGASMRPRQACLGMSDVHARIERTLIASMRPRQACLGMRNHSPSNADIHRLLQ